MTEVAVFIVRKGVVVKLPRGDRLAARDSYYLLLG